MKNTELLVAAAMIAALALPFGSESQAGLAPKPKFDAEKCYGIAKAPKNDCQTANSSCAGTSRRDGQMPLLGMILTIPLFVYPEAWPEHLVWGAMLAFLLTRGAGQISLDRLLGLERGDDAAR